MAGFQSRSSQRLSQLNQLLRSQDHRRQDPQHRHLQVLQVRLQPLRGHPSLQVHLQRPEMRSHTSKMAWADKSSHCQQPSSCTDETVQDDT